MQPSQSDVGPLDKSGMFYLRDEHPANMQCATLDVARTEPGGWLADDYGIAVRRVALPDGRDVRVAVSSKFWALFANAPLTREEAFLAGAAYFALAS